MKFGEGDIGPVVVLITSMLIVIAVGFAAAAYVPLEIMKIAITGKIISRTIVLFLIVPVVAYLCMKDKITGEAAISLFSSIAGYVLGTVTG